MVKKLLSGILLVKIFTTPPANSPGISAEGDLNTKIRSIWPAGIISNEKERTSVSIDGAKALFN